MCVLLIKATDNTHPDPVEDRRCYKAHMVVRIEDNDYQWGSDEGPPNFYLIEIPDVEKEELEDLISRQTTDDDGVEQGVPHAGGVSPATYRRREYKLNFAALPASIKANIQSSGKASVPEVQILNQFKRIRDNKPVEKRPKN